MTREPIFILGPYFKLVDRNSFCEFTYSQNIWDESISDLTIRQNSFTIGHMVHPRIALIGEFQYFLDSIDKRHSPYYDAYYHENQFVSIKNTLYGPSAGFLVNFPITNIDMDTSFKITYSFFNTLSYRYEAYQDDTQLTVNVIPGTYSTTLGDLNSANSADRIGKYYDIDGIAIEFYSDYHFKDHFNPRFGYSYQAFQTDSTIFKFHSPAIYYSGFNLSIYHFF